MTNINVCKKLNVQDLAKLQKFMQTETFQKLEESIKIAENAELTIGERYEALKFISEQEELFYLLQRNVGVFPYSSYDVKSFFKKYSTFTSLFQKTENLVNFIGKLFPTTAQLHYKKKSKKGLHRQYFSITQIERFLVLISIEDTDEFRKMIESHIDFGKMSFKKSPYYKFRNFLAFWLQKYHKMKLCPDNVLTAYKKVVVEKYTTSIYFNMNEKPIQKRKPVYYYSSSDCAFWLD